MRHTMTRISHLSIFVAFLVVSLSFTPASYSQLHCGTPPAGLLNQLEANPAVPSAPSLIPNTTLENKIQVVYFVPRDRDNQIKKVAPKIRQNVEQALGFFSEQRQVLDFGTRDIDALRTEDGDVEIQTLTGRQRHNFYESQSWAESTWLELLRRKGELSLDIRYSIVLLFLEKDTDDVDGADGIGMFLPPAGGIAWLWVNDGDVASWRPTAHEIGHTLGLDHNFNSELFIMSYSRRPDRLAWVEGQFLNASRYFNNFRAPNDADNALIEIVAPAPFTYDSRTNKTSLTFRVRDTDGVAHLMFMTTTGEAHPITRSTEGIPEVYWNNPRVEAGQRTVLFTVDFFADAPDDNPLPFEKGGDGINPIWQDRWGYPQTHRGNERGVAHELKVQVIDKGGAISEREFDLDERPAKAGSLAVEAAGKELTTWGQIKTQ
jgi:hypothetical protein